MVCNNGPAQGLTWASPGFGPGQPRPAQVNFLVQILVKQNNSSNSIHCNNKGGRARQRAPPFVVAVPAVVSVVSVSAVCDQVDQVDQVVPAHQVDDIDEAHQVDPVHQVDLKDELSSDLGATRERP